MKVKIKEPRGKKTTHLWRYTRCKKKKKDPKNNQDKYFYKNYFAVSIPPVYYEEFLGKELFVKQCGSSLVITISGCTFKLEEELI